MPFFWKAFFLAYKLCYICKMNENLDPTNENYTPEEFDLKEFIFLKVWKLIGNQ